MNVYDVKRQTRDRILDLRNFAISWGFVCTVYKPDNQYRVNFNSFPPGTCAGKEYGFVGLNKAEEFMRGFQCCEMLTRTA